MQNVHKHFAHDLCDHKDQGFDEDQNYEKKNRDVNTVAMCNTYQTS